MAEDVGYSKIFENASLPDAPPSDKVFGFELERDLFLLSEQEPPQTDNGDEQEQENSEDTGFTNDNEEDDILDEQERAGAHEIGDGISNINAAFDTMMS